MTSDTANFEANVDTFFDTDHIHVRLGPGYSLVPENQELFWKRIKSLCEEHGSRRVLVEGFAPAGELDTVEIVESGERTAAVPDLWLAFHLNDFVPSESTELFITVAASRGVRAKFFSDEENALKWLRANAPA